MHGDGPTANSPFILGTGLCLEGLIILMMGAVLGLYSTRVLNQSALCTLEKR